MTTPPSFDTRAILDDAIAKCTRDGWTVLFRSDTEAVLEMPAHVNHAGHAIASLLTAGLWLIVWLFAAIGTKPIRRTIRVGPDGEIQIS